MLSVLVVDDDILVQESLKQLLDAEYRVLTAGDAREAMAQYNERELDVVLLDYSLPDGNGLELLERMRRIDPDPPVLMLTAHSSVEHAVEAMKLGAFHYACKPLALDELRVLIARAAETGRLRREVRRLRSAEVSDIVGGSAEMRRVKETLAKIARNPTTTILITGESGTGKDLVARSIHRHSDRRDGPFMNITCSALPEALLESELFGHEPGAFTDAKRRKIGLLEQASGGTVFLDEIGEMTPALQAKLLRFLEEKAFRRVGGAVDIRPDVRVLAATNRDLDEEIRCGGFRSDLYYRLAVLQIRLPALRERPEDILPLAWHFAGQFCREFGKTVRSFSPQAVQAMERYPWPGNIRELRNAIERAVLLLEGQVVERIDLDPGAAASASLPKSTFDLPAEGVDLEGLERDLLVQALDRARGNRSRAARLLGLTRDQVRYRIAKFNLE